VGKENRCCVICLEQLGGPDQLAAAAEENYRINTAAESVKALDMLRTLFPDPKRRPYGEETLINALTIGSTDPDRIIEKIRKKAWTEYDLARIEGRPEPSKKGR